MKGKVRHEQQSHSSGEDAHKGYAAPDVNTKDHEHDAAKNTNSPYLKSLPYDYESDAKDEEEHQHDNPRQ